MSHAWKEIVERSLAHSDHIAVGSQSAELMISTRLYNGFHNDSKKIVKEKEIQREGKDRFVPRVSAMTRGMDGN